MDYRESSMYVSLVLIYDYDYDIMHIRTNCYDSPDEHEAMQILFPQIYASLPPVD